MLGPHVNIFFDVQGTLLSMEEAPRPRAREALLMLRNSGHALCLWSSGGAGYAATAAELLGVADLVSGCFGKRREPGVPIDFAVDDDASVVEAHGGHRIKPFDGDPLDEELLRAAEAVGR
jgi:phosphoglycolate phosphatase-like HAD superfamily hydrolase